MDDATAHVRKVWEDQADSWYAERDMLLAASRLVHDWLVRHVDPQHGQRVLEIGAGPGDTGFLVAPLLGPGRLVSTDIAPGMVEAARRRGAELGIQNVDYRVLDAQAMDLDDASFDGVVSRWGYMLMPDPLQALRETRRVLKPGGRLAFAVFTGPAENPWVSIAVSVLGEGGYLPAPSDEWSPGILALADRGHLQGLVESAGFASSSLEIVDMAWTFDDADGYWRFLGDVTALGPVFRGLTGPARDAVRAAIDARLAPFTDSGRVVLPAQCWGGLTIR